MASRKKQSDATPGPTPSVEFRGFGTQSLPFLQVLAENNDREWFAANKSTYLEECDAPLRELVQAVGAGLAARGIPLAPTPKNPVYRIYRDVRFGRDKRPYKTNMGAALYPDGDKTRPGLLYLHVEPGKSLLAAGFYQPDAPLLHQIRTAIAQDPQGFTHLIATLKAHGLHLDPGDPLTRTPKGFEDHATSPHAEILRKRSFITSQPLPDEDLERRDLPEVIIQFTTKALPLLEFLQQRISGSFPS